jgi:RNA polymerase sigma-70 factor (ECF subfamily)
LTGAGGTGGARGGTRGAADLSGAPTGTSGDAGSTTQSLSLWIQRLRGGDPRAKQALIARAQERLAAMAGRLRRNFRLDPILDTGDVLQEASIRLMHALDDVEPTDVRHFLNLSAMKIRQTLLDLVRRPAAARGVGGAEDTQCAPIGEQVGTLTLDPEALARWTEFHEMIQRLPEDEREVVHLLWYHDLTQADAAGVLGVAEKTVHRRWLRARLKLGQWLAD